MTRIFFDFEFTGLHQETTPISLGIISDCGKTFYAEFSDYDRNQVDQWIEENVIKKLRFSPPPEGQQEYFRMSRVLAKPGENSLYDGYSVELRGDKTSIKEQLEAWLKQFDRVEVWGDCLAYDWMLFCQIFGHAFNIPKNVYYIPFDLCTLLKSRGIDPDINREDFARGGEYWYTEDQIQKHNALWDAKVIKACVDRIEKPLHQQQAIGAAPEEAITFSGPAGQLLDSQNKLNAAQAEIDQLRAELRENANSCSQTNLEIEWCRSCTSKRWCVNGMKLLEESDGEQKTSKTPRTDKMNTLLLGRPLREAYEEMTEFSRDMERQRDEALNTSAARARIVNKQTLELAGVRADVEDRDNALAAIMAVLPDSAKPCDAPDLIKHFKSQMSAFGSEYIRIEKQLKEARAEIERLDHQRRAGWTSIHAKNELIEQLCKGLEAVIRVADRDTDEFALAKSALSAAKRRDQ